MRLHRLELRAFGPFVDEVAVDLDALGCDGLFLLHGDTGAGKTTLLDAVAFALYGRVPGARNEAKRLRCDRAAPGTRTQVRLEATIAGHRIELTRNPEYQRPKSRGTGFTTEKAKVVLRWIGPAPSGRHPDGLTRADEVGDVVAELLGMSADQFFQVVLLPQGDFARFLRADTVERGALLERLFDTGRFGTVEEWFATARREAGAQLRDADARVDRLIARVAEAARVDIPDESDPRWTADLRDRLADLADTASEEATRARRDREVVTTELRATQDRHERILRLRGVRERLAGLDSRAAELARNRLLIERHRQTAHVVTAHHAVLAAERDQARAERQRAACVAALAEVADRGRGLTANTAAVGPAGPTVDPLEVPGAGRAMAAADRELAGALAEFLAQAAAHDRDLALLDGARRRHHQAEVDAVDVEQQLAGLPTLLDDLAERVRAARSARDRSPAAEERVAAATVVLQSATAVGDLTSQVSLARERAAAAVDAHQRAVDVRQCLVERRIAGIAAELAAGLTPAGPCPVCGSAEHPRPAVAAADAVTAAALRSAQEAERVASAERDRSAVERSRVDAALTRAVELAAGHGVDAAHDLLRRAQAECTALAGSARTLDDVLGRQDSAGKALFEHSLRRDELARSVAAAKAEIAALVPGVQERGARLQVARAGFPSVPARRAHLLERAEALEALAAASEVQFAARRDAAGLRQELDDAVVRAGFADLAEALDAASVDADRLSREVRGAEDERTAILGQLTDPALAGVSPDEQVGLPQVRARAAAAAARADVALSRADAAVSRRDQVGEACRRLRAAGLDREPVSRAEAEIAALADVMQGRGQNALGMSLRTYVLAARLRQVADTAGQRLAKMSAGRYSFVHSTERESRGRAGGLGLDIVDAWSGLVRPAKTLSGGESFLASLALALGLADVVAAEAGGRVLDTLFVDEGFGGLDADTLDLVMGTLDDLRAGGRVVGVVSHVTELQQRIPSRVCVRRTPQGSTLELHVA